jgi:hypothetical protein
MLEMRQEAIQTTRFKTAAPAQAGAQFACAIETHETWTPAATGTPRQLKGTFS